jgi:hypothetical protein
VTDNKSKEERIKEFFRRLKEAKTPASHDEAFSLITDTLNQVENELTSIPYNPEAFGTDGRLYPPQLDSVRRVEGRKDMKRYRSKGHNTFISEDGSIEIKLMSGELVFEKKGLIDKGADHE